MKIPLFAGIALFLTVSHSFALPHRPQPVTGHEEYLEAQNLIYGEADDYDRIENLLESAGRSFSEARPTELSDYWLSRLHLLTATWYNWRNESRRAQWELEEAFRNIDSALSQGDFSDGWRVFADANSQMAMARGFIYMIRHGEEVRNATLLALDLDPANIHANITAAGYYLNAPAFAGGDPARGLQLLEYALNLEEESEADRFLVLAWLSVGYAKEDDKQKARRYWYEALRIFPDSSFLQTIDEEYDLTP